MDQRGFGETGEAEALKQTNPMPTQAWDLGRSAER
jgi:hypothetical protein